LITQDMYKSMLTSRGRNLSQARRNQSDMIMNATFTGDTGYKRVYILDPERGWHYEDAKYSKHATVSILKDAVDYYLQFRPNTHYQIGLYVFIPDDVSDDIGFKEFEPIDPFQDEGFDMNKLWMIVNKNDDAQFVRYNILKCNWDFRWICKVHGKMELMHIIGCSRNANSYTSGIWAADYTVGLDNITSGWVPDTHYLYGDEGLKRFNLCDTRYMEHEQRFVMSHNKINPKVYEITKVVDLNPMGVINLTLKQDEWDEKRDNKELLICNYYDDTGETQIVIPEAEPQDTTLTSYIYTAHINEDGELELDLVDQETRDRDYNKLEINGTYYFVAEYYTGTVGGEQVIEPERKSEWKLNLKDTDGLTDAEIKHLDNMMVMETIDDNVISIHPKRAKTLIGHTFTLTVTDMTGESRSTMDVEVIG